MKALRGIIVLCIFVICIICVACGKPPQSEVLTIWAWNRNVDIMNAAIEKYQLEVDPNFKANVEPFSQGDIDTKIKTASQLRNGSDLADIILGDAMRMLGYYDLWPELFLIFDNYGVSETDKEAFVSSTIDIVTVNEKIFAMPYGIAPTVVFAYRPLWNQDDIDHILSNGWTWDEYTNYGIQIQDENPDITIYMTAYNMRSDDRLYRTMTSQKGEWFMDKDLSVQVANENSIWAMTKIQSMMNANVVGHVDTGDYRSMMLNGTIAAQVQGFFLGGQIRDIGQSTSGDWIILPLPSWETGESSVSITGGSYLYVNALKPNHEKAADFVKWLTLDAENAVQGLIIGGIFPALLSAYETDYFNSEDPFYGNQRYLYDIALSLHQAQPIFPSKYNAFNYNAFIAQQENILFNDADIVYALNQARQQILNNAD